MRQGEDHCGVRAGAEGCRYRLQGLYRAIRQGCSRQGVALLEYRVPEIFAEQYGSGEGCYFGEGRPDELDRSSAGSGVAKAMDAMLSRKYDVVILDEITIPVRYGVLDESVLLEFADRRPPSVELVMTGRYAPQSLIDRADLVTEMGEVKHYWRDGVAAREGIED